MKLEEYLAVDIVTNQSRIEVMTMISANCYEELNDPVSDKVSEQIVVGF